MHFIDWSRNVSIINLDHISQFSAIIAKNQLIWNFGNDCAKLCVAIAESDTQAIRDGNATILPYISVARKILLACIRDLHTGLAFIWPPDMYLSPFRLTEFIPQCPVYSSIISVLWMIERHILSQGLNFCLKLSQATCLQLDLHCV
jgi:hypothetical protein